MGTELAPITEIPELPPHLGPLTLEFTIGGYSLDVENLKVSQRTYESDFIGGRRGGTVGAIVWFVLTPEVSEKGFPKGTLKKINQYSRQLREEIAGLRFPLEVHTSFVRPEREQALRDHLERNKITYTY